MRMIPTVISQDTPSDAERRVFELLRATDIGPRARAFHSLNLAEHDYKRSGELDFVVLTLRGLLVLEVKGGGVSLQGGIWRFRDRYGVEHHRSEGPFQQARSGMFALEKRLDREIGEDVVSHIAIGYGVLFTDVQFRERSVEWSADMSIDANGLRGRSDLRSFLDRLYRYWSAKSQGRRSEMTPTVLDRVSSFLRPDFDRVPSLHHRADIIDATTERLTREQYSRLDLIEENPRILIAGGAGTGKTFLAAELARRHAAQEERVLFVTRGSMLAAFVRSRLDMSNIRVIPLSALTPEDRDYDVAIVDEGQDLLNFEDLDRIDGAIKGGLARGCWRIFYDANKQTGIIGRFDPQSVDLLKSYGAVMAALKLNCRNTRQILTYTKLLTAADLGTPTAGDGPQVSSDVFSTDREAAALVDAELERLDERGVPPGDITILSPVSINESCVRFTNAYNRGRVHELDYDIVEHWPARNLTFATVPEFKGLENRFILVVDVASLDATDHDVNTLYVALSRARAGLWIAVRKDLQRRVNEISRANYERVLADDAISATEAWQ